MKGETKMAVIVRAQSEVRVEVINHDTYREIRIYQSRSTDMGLRIDNEITLSYGAWEELKAIVESEVKKDE
jgi:hypothetical protein